jgi:hypothetical protein
MSSIIENPPNPTPADGKHITPSGPSEICTLRNEFSKIITPQSKVVITPQSRGVTPPAGCKRGEMADLTIEQCNTQKEEVAESAVPTPMSSYIVEKD